MNWYLCQLLPPRPDFATSMTDDEHSTMGRHVHYWSEVLAAGQATIFSPVSDPAGGWGMAVVRAAAEDEVRALGDADPAVVERVARYDVLSLPGAMTAAPGQVK